MRVLRLLRVFRILKLGSYLDEAEVLRQALVASRRKISVFLLTIVALVVLIGTLMYVIEGEAQRFRQHPGGDLLGVVTITTVGYGDVAPVTTLGRFVASLVMLLGYSIIAVPTGILTVGIQQASRRQENGALPQLRKGGRQGDARFAASAARARVRRTPPLRGPALASNRSIV